MKFTCTKENISKVLNLVSPLASKQSHLPILMNVLIIVNNSKVEIVATNLEVAIRAVLRAKVDIDGSFTVPAKTLSDYINLLSEGQIEVSLEGNELIINNGSSSTKIKGISAEEFPVVPEVEAGDPYLVPAIDFKDALTKTVIAAAKNEIRPELSGVYMGFFTDRYSGLVLAATDSYRLAEARVKIDQGEIQQTQIIPARTVYEVIRLLGISKDVETEKQAKVWISNNQIALRYDSFELTSRLVDGKYPDYAQIIPTEFKTKAVFPSDIMMKKIKAAGLFTATGVNAVSFDFNKKDNLVTVSSTSAQTGEHKSDVDSDITGDENSILLNHRYVLDGLQQIGGDVAFNVNSADAPCMFTDNKKGDYLYIVMPIRQ